QSASQWMPAKPTWPVATLRFLRMPSQRRYCWLAFIVSIWLFRSHNNALNPPTNLKHTRFYWTRIKKSMDRFESPPQVFSAPADGLPLWRKSTRKRQAPRIAQEHKSTRIDDSEV